MLMKLKNFFGRKKNKENPFHRGKMEKKLHKRIKNSMDDCIDGMLCSVQLYLGK